MSLETESILDRRRLRRKLGFWRSLAIISLVVALAAGAYLSGNTESLIGQSQIARVSLTGVITDNRRQLQLLKRIAKADEVKGVVLFVNSPGGTTTGAEALYGAIQNLAEVKPVVAQFGTVAASAAYIAGLATDHIVARENTITGSVGVIMQWPEVSGLLEKIGVKINELKSGTLKAAPSPFKPASPEATEISEEMIAEGLRWFVGLVEQRRNITATDVPGLIEGRVFLGGSAVKYKLIDSIGGEDEAVAWMVKNRGVGSGLKIVDWRADQNVGWPLVNSISNGFATVFIQTAKRIASLTVADEPLGRLGLDGLVSVWQPGKN
ncbi:MAG: signal peptide peptidase SppA [Hyphomicrobiaceae bacterium]